MISDAQKRKNAWIDALKNRGALDSSEEEEFLDLLGEGGDVGRNDAGGACIEGGDADGEGGGDGGDARTAKAAFSAAMRTAAKAAATAATSATTKMAAGTP